MNMKFIHFSILLGLASCKIDTGNKQLTNQLNNDSSEETTDPYQKRNKKFLKARDECQKDPATATNDKDEIMLTQGQVIPPAMCPNIFCILKKIDLVNGKGELNITEVRKDLLAFSYKDDEIKNIINDCDVKVIDDPEKTVCLKLFKCLRNYWRPPTPFVEFYDYN